jgi:hypothetical protein
MTALAKVDKIFSPFGKPFYGGAPTEVGIGSDAQNRGSNQRHTLQSCTI